MNLHENKANLVATNCHVELGAERGKAMERELVVGFDRLLYSKGCTSGDN